MELMRIHLSLEPAAGLDSLSAGIRMIPFSGYCESAIFNGKILPGGMDTQVFPEANRGTLSARYMLEGTDASGAPCKLYIDNRAVMQHGQETITCPRIWTDSPALRWLETADLTGRLVEAEDGLNIVIDSQDTPTVRHIALHRAGLTLRGRLEKKNNQPCPLVLMLHGFGGCGDMGRPGTFFQDLSDLFTDAGLATLRFDFNGHGVSEGEFTAMTPLNEVEDAALFLQYAQDLEGITEIYVLGHSQGGVVGGMLAGYYADVVKKLVLLAPAASLKTDAQQGKCMAATYDPHQIPRSVNVNGYHVVGGLYFRMAQTLPIYEVTAKYQQPMLVVCGGQDKVVLQQDAEQYLLGREAGKFVLYETLDHIMNGSEQSKMQQEVLAFLLG